MGLIWSFGAILLQGTRFPEKVGIKGDGIIIILNSKKRYYTWKEIDIKPMNKHWPKVKDLITTHSLVNFAVKKEIVRAIIQKYNEIYSPDDAPSRGCGPAKE